MSHGIEHIDVNGWLPTATIHNGIAYLSGVVPAEGTSVAAQTRSVLDQIDGRLARCGTSKKYLLEVSIWLSDISTFGEMNPVYIEWLHGIPPPARACVEAKLARPEWTVEIRVNAVVPK
ncbi:enamine/imine deaminase [bacterium BMS3Bbin02]|nr:enamine/imine deaminase [bacterium BMS3Bbin02]